MPTFSIHITLCVASGYLLAISWLIFPVMFLWAKFDGKYQSGDTKFHFIVRDASEFDQWIQWIKKKPNTRINTIKGLVVKNERSKFTALDMILGKERTLHGASAGITEQSAPTTFKMVKTILELVRDNPSITDTIINGFLTKNSEGKIPLEYILQNSELLGLLLTSIKNKPELIRSLVNTPLYDGSSLTIKMSEWGLSKLKRLTGDMPGLTESIAMNMLDQILHYYNRLFYYDANNDQNEQHFKSLMELIEGNPPLIRTVLDALLPVDQVCLTGR